MIDLTWHNADEFLSFQLVTTFNYWSTVDFFGEGVGGGWWWFFLPLLPFSLISEWPVTETQLMPMQCNIAELESDCLIFCMCSGTLLWNHTLGANLGCIIASFWLKKTPNDLTNDTIDIYMYIYLNSLRIFMFYIYTCIMSVIWSL